MPPGLTGCPTVDVILSDTERSEGESKDLRFVSFRARVGFAVRRKWSAPAGNFPGRGCLGATRTIGKRTCKPNSVVCGHSSRRRVAADVHQRPTRRFRQLLEPPERIGPMRSAAWLFSKRFPPYLVLLRVGFTLPPALPPGRCALAAPFHPYPGAGVSATASLPGKPANSGIAFPGRPSRRRGSRGGIFSVALAVREP